MITTAQVSENTSYVFMLMIHQSLEQLHFIFKHTPVIHKKLQCIKLTNSKSVWYFA